uniref:ANK_REP_REGION domain-containing protein n=1 Tax=Echinostoma caproni TaxID=27848 RepID=A0A183AUL2_9TREM
LIPETAPSSCEDIGIDLFLCDRLSDVEYADDVILLIKNPGDDEVRSVGHRGEFIIHVINQDLAHPVFQLASQGDAEGLNSLLSADPQLINRPDYDDRDAACCAVTAGSIECLQLLLDAGARTDYRFATEIPILVDALTGSNIQITRLVLESIEADFALSRRDQYWLVALKRDLRITLEYFKLLKAYAVPYGIGDFEELCLSLIEWEPSTPGLEELLVYLCVDATDRWSRHREEVVEGLRRITSFCLRKLVPQTRTLDSVHRLQQLGVLEPPRSVRAWLRLLNEWGVPFGHIDDPVEQDKLLSDLSTANHPVPLIHDPSLTPLVLYFATLSLKFPHPGWLTSWSAICTRIGYDGCSLSTLFELHTVRHSRSAPDFFWCEVFPLTALRAISVADSNTICLPVICQELENLVDHILSHCPSMRPDQCGDQENLLFKVLSSFPASCNAPGHPLFISFASRYLLPWVHEKPAPQTRPHGLITSTVHVLSHRTLLETVLDYSPAMALYLIRNLHDWPRRAQSHISLLADCLVLAYTETQNHLVLPEQLTGLLPIEGSNLTDLTVSSTLSTISDWFREWFVRIQSEPLSLRTLAKLQIRLLIRRSLSTAPGQGSKPLSCIALHLPIPPALRTFIVNCELV